MCCSDCKVARGKGRAGRSSVKNDDEWGDFDYGKQRKSVLLLLLWLLLVVVLVVVVVCGDADRSGNYRNNHYKHSVWNMSKNKYQRNERRKILYTNKTNNGDTQIKENKHDNETNTYDRSLRPWKTTTQITDTRKKYRTRQPTQIFDIHFRRP